MNFTVEDRDGVPVLVFAEGCRPATHCEATLWAEVERLRDRVTRPRNAASARFGAPGEMASALDAIHDKADAALSGGKEIQGERVE